jgi:eukaryotic-like serine/threonine-protein kinase
MNIDGYELLERLNRGREIDVYDAWSEVRGCRCVLKTLRPDVREDAAAARRLRAEGRLLLSLTHPHIARAYELLNVDGVPVLVLETLGGATLSWLVREGGVWLKAEDLCHLGLQLCSAVGYLHRGGLLHLDLKPSNVISENGIARVIDLNLARRPGRVPPGYGTAQYLAPEQARGGRVDAAADVWGIGATLFAAATTRRPFDITGTEQLARRAESVRRVRRGLPRAFTDVVDACLEPAPTDRPALADLEAELDALLPENRA